MSETKIIIETLRANLAPMPRDLPITVEWLDAMLVEALVAIEQAERVALERLLAAKADA